MSDYNEDHGGPGDPFTAEEEVVLDALALGLTHAEAAKQVNRQAKFVQRLLGREDFRVEYGRRRAAQLDAIVGQLRDVSHDAVGVLRRAMADDNITVALRAAVAALTLVGRIGATADLELRISALESRQLGDESTPGWEVE